MDGVLIDAREWHYEALNEALAIFGVEISLDSHLSTYDGLPTRVKLERLTMLGRIPRGLHETINSLKQRITIEKAHALCRPTFNHRYCLQQLKSRGYTLSVCSNSVRQTIDMFLKLAKLNDYCDLIVSNEDVLSPKPSPEMYLLAMERLQSAPSECLIVEDSDHGYQAAVDSGAHVIRVLNASEVTYQLINSFIASL